MSSLPARTRMLTPKERLYLLDAARGLTAQQSAHRQGVSINTAVTMLTRAKAALGAVNITHAAALAVANGEINATDLRGTS